MTRLTPEQRADRDMSESKLKEEVLAIARAAGWRVFHLTHDRRGKSTAKGNGYPDLTCARWNAERGRAEVIFAELKRQSEELEPDQVEWMTVLGGARFGRGDPVVHYTMRPSDLREGWIERWLR